MQVRRPKHSPLVATREHAAATARRISEMFSHACAVIAAVLGSLGVAVVVLGIRTGLLLSDNVVGQKFTERSGAIVSGFISGATFELASIIFLAIAILHSPRRPRTLLAGLPIVAFVLLFFAVGVGAIG